MKGLTATEERLAEQYVSVLDYVSRCALGIDRGDWFYLYDKAGTLARKPSGWPSSPARPTTPPAAPQAGGGGGGGLVRPSLPRRPAAPPPRPGVGMAWPAPRRPAPGGGLAVLVVVTVLAALAAPHATAVRGLVAGGLPTITAPTPSAPPPATRPPSGLSFTNAAGCRPAGDYRLPAAGPPGPDGAGRCRRPLPASGVVPAQRPFLVRQGHPAGLQPQRLARRSTSTRSTAARSARANPAARRLAVWIGQGRAGVQPSEVGSPWTFGGRPWFTDAGHQGHLHVGFGGPTRPGGGR